MVEKTRSTSSAPVDTPERLLAVAEAIVARDGAAALTLRRLAARAGANSALVSYHFGGLPALLERLLAENIESIHASRLAGVARAKRRRGDAGRLEQLVIAYVEPMWRTPATRCAEPARVVVRELLPVVRAPARAAAVARINESVQAVAVPLAPLLPHLRHDELLWRLRLLSGATDTVHPRLDEYGLYPLRGGSRAGDIGRLRPAILRFSMAALRHGR